MPELPEVETIKRDLDKEISGFKIVNLWFNEPKLLLPSANFVKENIIGLKIDSVERRAKLILINLSEKGLLVIHLKLTGRLLVRKAGNPQDEWVHVILSLIKGGEEKELRFSDLRKFGYIKLVDKKELERIFKEFGPEFFKDLDLETFQGIVKKSAKRIKELLMDQRKISGVGNIYANEALYEAGIHPEIKANNLSDSQVACLYKALELVLKEGIKYRGSSGEDEMYRDAYGKKGNYQQHFRVYQREGLSCLKCRGSIKRIKIGGRGTFYCPKCQRED